MSSNDAMNRLGIGTTYHNWANQLHAFLNAEAINAEENGTGGPLGRRHVSALRDLRDGVTAVDVQDARHLIGMRVLQLKQIANGGTSTYTPSPMARRVINNIGLPQSHVSQDELLDALFAGELTDLMAAFSRITSERDEAVADTETAKHARRVAEEGRDKTQAALAVTEAALRDSDSALRAAERRANYLAGLVAAMEGQEFVDVPEDVPAVTEPDADDQAEREDNDSRFPTAADIAKLDTERRVKLATGLFIEKHDGDVQYWARFEGGSAWLGSATSGDITIQDAAASRERMAAAARAKADELKRRERSRGASDHSDGPSVYEPSASVREKIENANAVFEGKLS